VRPQGLGLNRVYEDVASGKDANRPELVAARHALASGLVGGLVGHQAGPAVPVHRGLRGDARRGREREVAPAGRLLAAVWAVLSRWDCSLDMDKRLGDQLKVLPKEVVNVIHEVLHSVGLL
jgi:hypothetical protein